MPRTLQRRVTRALSWRFYVEEEEKKEEEEEEEEEEKKEKEKEEEGEEKEEEEEEEEIVEAVAKTDQRIFSSKRCQKIERIVRAKVGERKRVRQVRKRRIVTFTKEREGTTADRDKSIR